jgi:hypothetical protein
MRKFALHNLNAPFRACQTYQRYLPFGQSFLYRQKGCSSRYTGLLYYDVVSGLSTRMDIGVLPGKVSEYNMAYTLTLHLEP